MVKAGARAKKIETDYKTSITKYNEIINQYNVLINQLDKEKEILRYLEKDMCYKYNNICLTKETEVIQVLKEHSELLNKLYTNNAEEQNNIINNTHANKNNNALQVYKYKQIELNHIHPPY